MFPSLNLCPYLSHLRALRALLSSFCELTRTFSVTQTHSVTFIPSKYTYNHGDGEDEREHLPQVRTKSIFFLPSRKESSLVASWARASVALGRTLGSEREEKKQIAWSRIVFVLKERFIFQPKKNKFCSWRRGVHLLSFFSFLSV